MLSAAAEILAGPPAAADDGGLVAACDDEAVCGEAFPGVPDHAGTDALHLLASVIEGISSPGRSTPDVTASVSAAATCFQAGRLSAGSMVSAGMWRCSVNG
jgi:hypothetical protein